jgi:hypothetical protein
MRRSLRVPFGLDAQAVITSAEVRDECQEPQHKRDGEKQSPKPTEEPEPGDRQHAGHRGTSGGCARSTEAWRPMYVSQA